MSKKMIIFYLNKEDINQKGYNIILHIGKHINTKKELFNIFSSQLQFPPYFGENWDAFYDCLCNLDYLNTKRILVLHEDLPFEKSETDRDTYIGILSDIRSNILEDNTYQIDVAFPKKYKGLFSNYQES